MVKLGSLYPSEKKLRESKSYDAKEAKTPTIQAKLDKRVGNMHQFSTQRESPTYSNVKPWKSNTNSGWSNSLPHRAVQNMESHYGSTVQGWEEAQIAQLESKHKQLSRLESFVREEGVAIQRLTQNQNILRLAIRGIREQTNAALQIGDYVEVDNCRRQQLFLERELSQIHSLLALSSKRLEDTAVEINRIEQDISVLHQQLHRVGTINRSGRNPEQTAHRSSSGRETVWLEAELSRVQQHVSHLQQRRQELSSQVKGLTLAESNAANNADIWSNCATGADSLQRKPLSTW